MEPNNSQARALGRGLFWTIVALSVPVAVALPPVPSTRAQESRPDIIYFLADDFGARESVAIPTANGPVQRKLPSSALGAIDALAARGVTYTNAYASPVCRQTRAMTLTGRWQYRRSQGRMTGNGPIPPASAVMLPEMLRSLGYRSVLIGKWHLGTSSGQSPIGQGFDYWFGFVGVTPNYVGHDPEAPLVEQERGQARRTLRNTGNVTGTLAAKAVEILREQPADEPIFLAVWWTATHDPLQGTLTARTDEMDAAIARVVAEAPRPENTIFIFAGDNGRGASNVPLRGRKFDIFEGGVRVPLVIRWDAQLPAGRIVNAPASLMDLPPTLLAAAGGKPRPTDGINLLDNIPSNRTVFFNALSDNVGDSGDPAGTSAVRRGPWKFYLGSGTTNPRLYNLNTDIGETRDVDEANPQLASELRAQLLEFRGALND